MKYFLSDIIPQLQQYSRKLNDITCLANQNWILTNSDPSVKTVFIFRKNSRLLISKNGTVEESSWEHLSSNSLLIRNSRDNYLFKLGFLDKNILILKQDDIFSEYILFINENVVRDKTKTVDQAIKYLQDQYLEREEHIPNKNKSPIREKEFEEVAEGEDPELSTARLIAWLILFGFLLLFFAFAVL